MVLVKFLFYVCHYNLNNKLKNLIGKYNEENNSTNNGNESIFYLM